MHLLSYVLIETALLAFMNETFRDLSQIVPTLFASLNTKRYVSQINWIRSQALLISQER